jgi:hypothetical protein
MDWGMMQNPTAIVASAAGCAPVPLSSQVEPFSCRHGLLRPRLRFGFAMSLLILLADSVLRFSWLLRFVPKAFPSPDAFILCTQFLEVVRRAIWNLLRIEWENIKQKANQLKARDSLSDHGDDDDDFEYDGNSNDDDGFLLDGGGGVDGSGGDDELPLATTIMPKTPSSSSKPIERPKKMTVPSQQQQQQQQQQHNNSVPTTPKAAALPKNTAGKVAIA